MPLPDCLCKVINGESGYSRDNTSWIVGRIVRDFDSWKHTDVTKKLKELIGAKFKFEKDKAEKETPGSSATIEKASHAGLCVSIYKAEHAKRRHPGYDAVYWLGFVTSFVQLGIAAIPAGVFGDWGIFLITIAGISLSVATGALPQWAKEKWACRSNAKKTVILTRGNGSQHAIVVLGDGKGLDLEDLAAGQSNFDVSASWFTRSALVVLALMWIMLLITAAGIKQNTWFLLAIGGVGILQNIFVAGWRRRPEAFGIPLTFVEVFGDNKVMKALYAVEEKYPHVGASMVETFFPGGNLRADEKTKWEAFATTAEAKDEALKAAKKQQQQQASGGPGAQTSPANTTVPAGPQPVLNGAPAPNTANNP